MGNSVEDTGVQQSTIQQAQAATTAQNDPAGARVAFDALLHQSNLTNQQQLVEDDTPLPVYKETNVEAVNEKTGATTGARLTDDGRINIRINHFNRHLSQLLTSSLHQHVRDVEDSGPAPPPYVFPSMEGEKDVPLPPPLNIVIQVVGSRGDVQPFVALGKVLKNTYGHRVRLATHPTFKNFVQEHGLEFFSIGGDPARLMAFMVKNPGLRPGFRSVVSGDVRQRRKDVAEYIQGCWRSCYKADDGSDDDRSQASGNENGSEHAAKHFVADCIIANPPSFAHIHCAEKLGIPLHIMFTMPYSPTQAFPHPLANIQSSDVDPQLTNYISYTMIELLSWQGLGDIINRFRRKCLGLDPVSTIWAPGMLERLKVPYNYCWSPSLIPKPEDWGSHISISGFCLLDLASSYTPALGLQEFLDSGPPPIYIGFGSIVLDNPNAMTELIFEAVRKTGQRVLLSKGWGGMGADELYVPEGVFMIDNVPHDWLFKHVSCVVHHGGAGTTAAGITAGRPTLIVPFFGDQPFWGAMIARAGAGPDPIPHKQLTAEKLVNAINFCLQPETLKRAKELADKIAAERGSDTGAQSFHQTLEPDRLRCTLAPSRAAVWRIKRTKVRLSAFAACTLAKAGLLDFQELKLFRSQEYETDRGPWDPISGGFVAACGVFSGMAMGLADVPTETFKAFQLPFRSRRQQSQARERETPTAEKISVSPASLDQSQTSLEAQRFLARLQNPSDPSVLSACTSTIESSSRPDILESQLSPKATNAGRIRVRSQSECRSVEDRDMLRHKGAHISKGLGRFAKVLMESPMEISMELTKGFHNMPKLWGDDTVRPQAQVRDFKSGAKIAGQRFGIGWYDGVTDLVMQPWKGAQKEGVSGFCKGFGKGLGGFIAKPTAGAIGIVGYTMKGIQKEVQSLFGSNVLDYMFASRAAQGYEEWLQSSDADKQDVIARWKLIQKYLKKKGNHDEMMRDVLQVQRKVEMDNREARRDSERIMCFAQPASVNVPNHDSECTTLARDDSEPSTDSLEGAGIEETTQPPIQETPAERGQENGDINQAIQELRSQFQELMSQLQHQRQDDQAYQEYLRQTRATREAGAQRQSIDTDLESDLDTDGVDQKKARRRTESRTISRKAVPVAGGSIQGEQPPSYDPRRLANASRSVSEAQRKGPQKEKIAQEEMEEEIVVRYIEKQSLLDMQNKHKGKGHATVTENEDDEDLQRALKLSMQDYRGRHGEASGS